MNSTSTVSWHFNKLVEAGLLQKLPSKIYTLTEMGRKYNDINIPINIPAQVILGRFVPKFSFLLGVLLFGLLINVILLFTDTKHLYIAYSSIMIIIIGLVVVFWEWYEFQGKYEDFVNQDENK